MSFQQHRELLQLANVLVRSKWSRHSEVWQQEVVSRVMEKYLTAFGDSAHPDNARAWLSTVVFREGVSLNRADRVNSAGAVPDVPELTPVAGVENWLRQVVTSGPGKRAARRDLIDQVLGLVAADAGDLLQWKYLDRLSSFEIAEQLSVSEAVVNTRLTRAKRDLRRALEARPDLLRELHAAMPRPF